MSPFTVAHGVLGLEGIHRLAAPTDDYFDMNLRSGWPRIELDRIAGLHALPDADDNREATYAQHGEEIYASLVRGRTITYEGRVLARDLYSLRAHSLLLRRAASKGRLREETITVRPHDAIGGNTHQYLARVLALEMDDEQIIGVDTMPTPYQRSFVLTVRMSDPRFYLAGVDITAGGASGATVTVTNPGTVASDPVFYFNGPTPGDLTIERLDNLAYRKMVYEDVETTGQMRLDFSDRTFTRVSDGESFEHKRAFSESSWWDPENVGINPGTTQIKVTGGGTWNVHFTPAN